MDLNNLEDAPEDVQNAYDKYRKVCYEYYLAELRRNQVAPSWVVTGRSNYKGNPDKAERIERNAHEKFQKIDKTTDKIVNQYAKLERSHLEKVVDFGTSGNLINQKVRNYRKKYPNLEISQYSSGKHGDIRRKWYSIKNKKTNEKYSIEIYEDGTIKMGRGLFPIEASRSYDSKDDFYNQLEGNLSTINKKE